MLRFAVRCVTGTMEDPFPALQADGSVEWSTLEGARLFDTEEAATAARSRLIEQHPESDPAHLHVVAVEPVTALAWSTLPAVAGSAT